MSDTSPQKKNNWIWLVVLGTLALFAAAVYGVVQVLELFWHAPTVAMCGDKPMGPYDKCGSYQPGSNVAQSTSDATSQLQADQFGHGLMVYLTAIGIVFVISIVIGALFSHFKDKPKD